MATANRIKRLMIETLADNINEITLGFGETEPVFSTDYDGST